MHKAQSTGMRDKHCQNGGGGNRTILIIWPDYAKVQQAISHGMLQWNLLTVFCCGS